MPAPSAPRVASTRPCPAARECRVPPVVRAGVGRCGRGCRRSGHAGSGARRRCARVRCGSAPESSAPCVARRRSGAGSGAARGRWSTSVCGWPRPSASPGNSSARLWSHQGGRASSPPSIAAEGRKSAMSNQRLMKAKEKAGDGYAKTNAIAPPPVTARPGPLGLRTGEHDRRVRGAARVHRRVPSHDQHGSRPRARARISFNVIDSLCGHQLSSPPPYTNSTGCRCLGHVGREGFGETAWCVRRGRLCRGTC